MGVVTWMSPVGRLTIRAAGDAIVGIDWRPAPPDDRASTGLLDEAVRQLAAYFERRLTRFDLPLAPAGNAFQRAVWDQMLAIPYGETLTYGDVARAIGGEPRSVGGACGANPIAIVVPCHRVVGAGGKLTGYSGGQGIVTKRALLELENPTPSLF